MSDTSNAPIEWPESDVWKRPSKWDKWPSDGRELLLQAIQAYPKNSPLENVALNVAYRLCEIWDSKTYANMAR